MEISRTARGTAPGWLAVAVLAALLGCGSSTPSGTASTPICTAECAGRQCGDDGCGGSCGTCPTGESCNGVGECVAKTIPPSDLTYSVNPAIYTLGLAIPANRPSSHDGPVAAYSVLPPLPPGLDLDTATGAITGTPTAVTPLASHLVTAANSAGSATASLSITVNESDPADAQSPDAASEDAGPGDLERTEGGPPDPGALDAGAGDAGPSFACDGTAAVVTAGRWQLRLAKNTGELTFTGPDLDGAAQATVVHFASPRARVAGTWRALGPVLACRKSADALVVTQDLDGHPAVAKLTAPHPEVLRYEVTDWGPVPPERTSLTGLSGEDEHFYGFGERFDSLDQTWRVVRTLTLDAYGAKGDRAYAVAPWFMSTRGYGFHLDSSAESSFDMRATSSDRYVVTNLDRTLRFNFVGGPNLVDVLERYTGYAGRPPLPPPWVFAPWMSSDVWRTGGEVRYVVTKLAEHGIPGSVFVFDSPWETAYNDFNWNMTQFGAAGTYEGRRWPGFATSHEMMEFLRAHGYRAVVWMTPFLDTRSLPEGIPGQNLGRAEGYDIAAASGYFVRSRVGGPPLVVSWWKGDGSPLDFTNPGARAWLADALRRVIRDSGGVISGIKADDGESDFIPIEAAYFDGRTGVEMRNAYSFEYLRAVHDAIGDQNVLFTRSGFTGTQAFPALWAGDNEPNFGEQNGLPSVIVAGLSAAMSGYAIWGHDIGGYEDSSPSSPPEDLFMRWTQFGALSPIMQMHRRVQRGMQYPWSYGEAALENYRAYARLHVSLFPYIYSYAKAAAETGVPIIRPLVLMNQRDPNTYWLGHTFLFGDELLVAPIFVGNTTRRDLYLPSGGWYDYWTNRRFEGGRSVTWSGAPTQIPMFVREGAIIPLISPDVETLVDAAYTGKTSLVTMTSALEFAVYPAGASQFTLHDATRVSCRTAPGTVELTLTSAARPVRFRVLEGRRPTSVTLNGLALAERANLDAAETGWAQTGDFIAVKFPHPGGFSRLDLRVDTR